MDNGEIDYYKSQRQPEEQLPPVEVPLEALPSDTLDSLIESFILREGTDYGSVEASLETKKSQIFKQLKKGDIKITFDPNTETVSFMTLRDWQKLQAAT
ncbi:MAG: YheU family protein [Bdellovibrionaceae bacterium]|nr:YheU family protein [Pseudobdellovibrionaceae bacterium]